jgi:hypothetical protein
MRHYLNVVDEMNKRQNDLQWPFHSISFGAFIIYGILSHRFTIQSNLSHNSISCLAQSCSVLEGAARAQTGPAQQTQVDRYASCKHSLGFSGANRSLFGIPVFSVKHRSYRFTRNYVHLDARNRWGRPRNIERA